MRCCHGGSTVHSGVSPISVDQRPERKCFPHRLFATNVDLSRCRHGGGTVTSGVFAASIQSLFGLRRRTWTRNWRASTACHGGATVAPPSLLELYRKPENQVLDATCGPAQDYLPLCAEDRGFAIAPSAKVEPSTALSISADQKSLSDAERAHRGPGIRSDS